MAKKSVIKREYKRKLLVEKYAARRKALKAEIAVLDTDTTSDQDQVFAKKHHLRTELDQMPRNASPKRQRNRCELTGRPRGVYRKFKLCRNMLRKFTMMGLVPGLRKASW